MSQGTDEDKIVDILWAEALGPVSISRDSKPRDVMSEPIATKSVTVASLKKIESSESAGRREFLQGILPASGKAFVDLMRNFGTSLSLVVEDTKFEAQKKSDE